MSDERGSRTLVGYSLTTAGCIMSQAATRTRLDRACIAAHACNAALVLNANGHVCDFVRVTALGEVQELLA